MSMYNRRNVIGANSSVQIVWEKERLCVFLRERKRDGPALLGASSAVIDSQLQFRKSAVIDWPMNPISWSATEIDSIQCMWLRTRRRYSNSRIFNEMQTTSSEAGNENLSIIISNSNKKETNYLTIISKLNFQNYSHCVHLIPFLVPGVRAPA